MVFFLLVDEEPFSPAARTPARMQALLRRHCVTSFSFFFRRRSNVWSILLFPSPDSATHFSGCSEFNSSFSYVPLLIPFSLFFFLPNMKKPVVLSPLCPFVQIRVFPGRIQSISHSLFLSLFFSFRSRVRDRPPLPSAVIPTSFRRK